MYRGLQAAVVGLWLVSGCFDPPEFQGADVTEETIADASVPDVGTPDADAAAAEASGPSCDGCPAGKGCTNSGTCDNLGRFCAYTESCPMGAGIGLDACLAQQCDGDQCLMNLAGLPTCSRACTIEKDDNADGIEDLDSPSTQCTNPARGPAGDATFRCVSVGPLTSTGALCIPGTDFRSCARDSDCPADEVCKITKLATGGRCAARPQSGEWGTAVDTGGVCDDRADGLKRFCASGRCDATMCKPPCQSNTDCVGAAETPTCLPGGTCEGWPGSSCTDDADCTRMWCDLENTNAGVPECAPYPCSYQDAACPQGSYCFTNALTTPTPGELFSVCVPELEGGAGAGSSCGLTELCETLFWCVDWGPAAMQCSPPCLSDADCGAGQTCAVFGQELAPGTGGETGVVAVSLCVPIDNATGEPCTVDSDCATGQCFVYGSPNVDPATGLPHADGGITGAGMCRSSGGAPDKSVCNANAECASGLCGGGNCISACTSQDDCKGLSYSAYCAGQRYFPEGIEGDLNVFVSGCFAAPAGASLADCAADFTCADGETCIAALIDRGPDFSARTDYLCMPTLGSTPAGGDCTGLLDCDSTLCVPHADGAYCSALCQTANDCPSGYLCTEVDVSHKQGAFSANGAPINLCLK